ncbi:MULTISPECIES: penicillin-binding transpeptidase domain-containing protein [unclassified Saccharothrix]|uniref:penicillin-binding transpeptidase domain-containing protein n=1 Tax=unclassified Saccharothrix TaxID=2593673 RepID=UPI00307F843E
MNKKTKRWVLAGGGLTAVAVIVTGAIVLTSGASPTAKPPVPTVRPLPGPAAQEFITWMMAGDAARAAAVTDAAGAAEPVLLKTFQGMAGVAFHGRLGTAPPPPESVSTTTIDLDVTWSLPDQTSVKYPTKVEVRLTDGKWRVHWAPTLLHPQLAEGQTLAYLATSGDGALLDRTGAPVAADLAPQVVQSVRKEVGSLTGTPGWQVAVVDPAGVPVTVVQEKKAQTKQTLTVTLDPAVQRAAQAAVDRVPQGAVIVAMEPSSGEILAVAQNTVASADGLVATQGWYEPGSTFKIVTAAAAITAGTASVDTVVECPGKKTIGTRQIVNDGQFELGSVPLRQAFAASCNTSFSQLAADLPADALPRAASLFGLDADFTIAGITTNTGKVPPAGTVPERVEAGIGQGKVLTTPFGMALVAATVARGSVPTPQLIREIPTTGGTGRALPGNVASALRTMMRGVVTGGTATELAGLGDVRGKTGTAQHGDGSRSHGWFIGYRGDLAFAVTVINGDTSKVAVGAAATFLGAL